MKNRFNQTCDRAGAVSPRLRDCSLVSSTLQICRRGLALSLIYLMIPLGIGDVYALGQQPPPPADNSQAPPPPDQDTVVDNGGAPPQQYNALSPDQLNQMVAPIALYPDALVAQILAASTFSAQVVDADKFVQAHPGQSAEAMAQMADVTQWDPSVKALTAFPGVLSNMDRNLQWTTQLGNAYFNQPQDVMSAVQVMRQRAYQAHNLRTTSQIAVTYAPDQIVIAPANPAFVYVPYYNPWTVYGAPLGPWGGYMVAPVPPGIVFGVGFGLGFGLGIGIGAWGHWGWGWGHWGCGWGSHAVFFNHSTYISRSVTVFNHGYYGRFDRNPTARAYNRNVAMHAANYNRAGFANRGGGRAGVGRAGVGHPGGARPGGARAGGARPGGVHPGGAHPGVGHAGGARPGAAHPGGAHPGGAHAGAAHAGAAHAGGGHPGGAHAGGGHAGGHPSGGHSGGGHHR
jgi:Protein of unknown function (DUF3300)